MADIVMTRKTLWQNIIIPIGTEFSVPETIATGLIRRNVAVGKIAAPIEIPEHKVRKHKPIE